MANNPAKAMARAVDLNILLSEIIIGKCVVRFEAGHDFKKFIPVIRPPSVRVAPP